MLAATAIPVITILAATGVSYMLDLWRATFPLNSAARSTGVAVVALLLILTLIQAYTQYFSAWAKSNATYTAYNETAVYAAKYLKAQKDANVRYLVATADEKLVVDYLAWGKKYRYVTAAGILKITGDNKGREFVVTTTVRTTAVTNLLAKLPGGVLRPTISAFSQEEINYVYEAAK